MRSRAPLACGGEGRDQKAGSPSAVRLRQSGKTQGGWSPTTPPARRVGDEIRAPATLVEAILTRSRTWVRFPPSPSNPRFRCKSTVFAAGRGEGLRIGRFVVLSEHVGHRGGELVDVPVGVDGESCLGNLTRQRQQGGFTFLRWRPEDRQRPDFVSVLGRHCAVQKYRAKADQWYGVMVPPTSADPLGPLLTMSRPWRQDPHQAAFAEAYIRTLQRGQ